MTKLISVTDAKKQILKDVSPLSTEMVSLAQAAGRTLAGPLIATRTQPPFPASAMDGYAVRQQDLGKLPCRLTVIGESAAGHGFHDKIGKGETVRIFTGAPVPEGADTIVIQENTVSTTDGSVQINRGETKGRYVRPAGLDFNEGELRLSAGDVLDSGGVTLAAAMNLARLKVIRKPRVAIIATGDELVMPGAIPGPDQIVASNSFGVAELVRRAGGEPSDLGIATDTLESLSEKLNQTDCVEADIVITLGGASVGDHDLVREALEKLEVKLDFWKLAMRPGKPVMYGRRQRNGGTVHFIGLPGNPVSSLVCTSIFLDPLIGAMLGDSTPRPQTRTAILAATIQANDEREEYMRASVERRDGELYVTAFERQDSSIITLYAKADCLIVRPANSPAMEAGETCQIVPLRAGV